MPGYELAQPDLWNQAYEWAIQRATEMGDVDIDRDYGLMDSMCEENYLYLCELEGLEPYIFSEET